MNNMRFLLTLKIIILWSTIVNGKKWNPEIICSTDTLIVEHRLSMKSNSEQIDSHNAIEPYKFVQCRTRSKIGYRLDVGISNFYYGEKTTSLIGQHGGPNISLGLSIDKFNFGFRFKPWTVNPKKEIELSGHTLPITADLNVIKLNYYIGYSFDFNWLFSIEPYIWYDRSSFIVINEDVLNHKFTFDETGGLLIGKTLNKYFKVKDYEYISLFGTVGYGIINYEKVHDSLDNGYFEWSLGIALKGFAPKHYNKRVE